MDLGADGTPGVIVEVDPSTGAKTLRVFPPLKVSAVTPQNIQTVIEAVAPKMLPSADAPRVHHTVAAHHPALNARRAQYQ